jgi:hypothetical protein
LVLLTGTDHRHAGHLGSQHLLQGQEGHETPLGIDPELPEMPRIVMQHVLFQRAGQLVELREDIVMHERSSITSRTRSVALWSA